MDIEIVAKLKQMFQFDAANAMAIGAFIVLVVAICKQHLKLSGGGIMIATGALALALNFMSVWPVETTESGFGIFVGSLVSWLVAVGGWSTFKQLAHKSGTPSTHAAAVKPETTVNGG